MAGKKFDSEKLRMDLIPVSAIKGLAAILTHGAKKYGDRNWEGGLAWSRPYAATLRHLTAWYDGEDLDGDSGFPHLYCALCEVAFLIEFATTHKELDDRPIRRAVPNSVLDSTESPSKVYFPENQHSPAEYNVVIQDYPNPEKLAKSENCTHVAELSFESSDSDPLHLVDE